MIAWEIKTEAEAIAAGRNPNLMGAGELWPDHIIEVQPTDASGGEIVWEWHAWDHLIQDYDETRENYGTVAEHPERINLNYAGDSGADWNHINAIDYDTDLDQILLSVHSFSEIWVIDHRHKHCTSKGKHRRQQRKRRRPPLPMGQPPGLRFGQQYRSATVRTTRRQVGRIRSSGIWAHPDLQQRPGAPRRRLLLRRRNRSSRQFRRQLHTYL